MNKGRDPGPAAVAAAAAAAASTRAGFLPGKKSERRGYMHQLFILSYPPLSTCSYILISGHMSQVFRVCVLVSGS